MDETKSSTEASSLSFYEKEEERKNKFVNASCEKYTDMLKKLKSVAICDSRICVDTACIEKSKNASIDSSFDEERSEDAIDRKSVV